MIIFQRTIRILRSIVRLIILLFGSSQFHYRLCFFNIGKGGHDLTLQLNVEEEYAIFGYQKKIQVRPQ